MTTPEKATEPAPTETKEETKKPEKKNNIYESMKKRIDDLEAKPNA